MCIQVSIGKTKRKISLLKTDNASHPNDIMMKNWIRIVPKTFTNNIQPKFLSRSGQMVHSIFIYICYTYVPASRYRIGFDMCFWYNISCIWKWINDFTFLFEVIWEFIVLFYVSPCIFFGDFLFLSNVASRFTDENVTIHDDMKLRYIRKASFI